MKHFVTRLIVAAPILMSLELFVMITSLSILFVFAGPEYNRLNNSGFGNVLNAVGIVAAFYIVYGYLPVRLITLAAALAARAKRRFLVACVGAITFGAYSLLLMHPAAGPGESFWIAWALVILLNFGIPFVLPAKVFE